MLCLYISNITGCDLSSVLFIITHSIVNNQFLSLKILVNIEGYITIRVMNCYSIYPPFFLITAVILPGKASTAARRTSWGTFPHSTTKDFFKDSILL